MYSILTKHNGITSIINLAHVLCSNETYNIVNKVNLCLNIQNVNKVDPYAQTKEILCKCIRYEKLFRFSLWSSLY